MNNEVSEKNYLKTNHSVFFNCSYTGHVMCPVAEAPTHYTVT